MEFYPLSVEVRLCMSSTMACLTKLNHEIESNDGIETDRLKAIIDNQRGACDRLNLVIDKLLEDS